MEQYFTYRFFISIYNMGVFLYKIDFLRTILPMKFTYYFSSGKEDFFDSPVSSLSFNRWLCVPK